jgi:hypothetical protein
MHEADLRFQSPDLADQRGDLGSDRVGLASEAALHGRRALRPCEHATAPRWVERF